jgi:NAD(P)-dependent dehydrogenase (short-subunit alcohol dehydrogenase family)
MTGELTGKTALVTGAARGIGRAVALKLARSGCDVAANYYNSADEAEALCAEIRALGRRAVPALGLIGCVTLAITLPVQAVVSGVLMLMLGALIYLVRRLR